MVGLFIPSGPVVQVKSKDEPASILVDRDRSVLYDGPLEVMVNEFSASASEIFAAAIQDYKRGIITGSSSTYGKGTVQRPFPINNTRFSADPEDLGTLHITIQKYYRINGSTTQLLGVIPDVVLPGYYEYYNLMEKDNKTALQWDEISKTIYQSWNPSIAITPAIQKFTTAKNSKDVFEQIRTNAEWLARESKQPISLNYTKYKQQQKEIREKVAATRKLLKLNTELQVDNNETDKLSITSNKEMQSRNERFLSSIKTDVYIAEALKIIYELTTTEKTGISLKKRSN
jgi:carboxyl-terminal processing protease